MFRITQNKGFQITFANGWTVSVQWGPGNYCDAGDPYDSETWKIDTNGNFPERPSATAEVAAWKDRSGKWYSFGAGADTVKGYMTPNEVLDFMGLIARKGKT